MSPTEPQPHRGPSDAGGSRDGGSRAGASPRPFLGVRFNCCGTYARAYRDAAGTAYRGRCPRCGLPITFRIGEGGTDARFFIVQ